MEQVLVITTGQDCSKDFTTHLILQQNSEENAVISFQR